MKAQIPAEGITLLAKYKDAIYYRVQCSCSNPDDNIEIMIERDEDIGEIIITLDATQKTHWWKTLADWDIHRIENQLLYWIANTTQSFINGLYQRLKITKEIWFDGYVKYRSSTLLSKQAALNMSEAIKNAIEELNDEKSSNP